MTIGSAASRPCHELAVPLPNFRPLEAVTPRRAEPCDGKMLAALRAQLALPAPRAFVSSFSLRN